MKLRPGIFLLVSFVGLALTCPLITGASQWAPVAPAPPVPVAPPIPAAPSMAITAPEAFAPGVPAEPAFPALPTGASWHSDGPVSGCSDLHIRFHDETPVMESEERTVTKAEAPVLHIEGHANGGVHLQGWDKETYSVTACKFAERFEAKEILSQIHLSVQNGEVALSGPSQNDHDRWTVFLLIRTPRDAQVELKAHNGPVGFYSVNGTIGAHATNGPITMRDCSGEAEIEAQNGPISYSGSGGNLRLHTQNGPITVSLGMNWTGSKLEADAVNGPVTLRVPSGFQGSFLLESNGNAPMSCDASICGNARKTWEGDRKRIEYGSGSPAIHLSTQNGPVSVRTAGD
jgi:hypothetical protein